MVLAITSGSFSSFQSPACPIARTCSPLSSSAISGPAPAIGPDAENNLRGPAKHAFLLVLVDVCRVDQLLRLEVADRKRHVGAHHDLGRTRLAGEELERV